MCEHCTNGSTQMPSIPEVVNRLGIALTLIGMMPPLLQIAALEQITRSVMVQAFLLTRPIVPVVPAS